MREDLLETFVGAMAEGKDPIEALVDSLAEPIYRASTIKRQRRTKEQIEQLDKQILQALRQDNPQSVRHVFYLMTNPRLPEPVEKSDRGYRHVQDRTAKLRRSGELPFSWITDSSRYGYFTPTYRSASDYLKSVAGHYRADLWQHSDYRCEVWVESRSIAGVILDDCRELAVSLYPAGGFTSMTLAYEAARYLNEDDDGREVVIFYIGDYDPAGVLIDLDIEKKLREHLRPEIRLNFERIAINEEQIAEYDLPTKPRKETDRRALHIKESVEAEAMPVNELRAIICSEVESLLPPDALRIAKVAEESEREVLYQVAEGLERRP